VEKALENNPEAKRVFDEVVGHFMLQVDDYFMQARDAKKEKVKPLGEMEKLVQSHGDMLAGCCLEHKDENWHSSIVKKVVAWYDTAESYAEGTERSGYVVFKTNDGRFAVLSDGEDYTGHGCQCSSSLTVWDNLRDALWLGLTDEERNQLVFIKKGKQK
jgi:hypothetical protein